MIPGLRFSGLTHVGEIGDKGGRCRFAKWPLAAGTSRGISATLRPLPGGGRGRGVIGTKRPGESDQLRPQRATN